MQPDDAKRHEVLERFLVGFEGTTLPDELAAMLAGGLAGVAIYPAKFSQSRRTPRAYLGHPPRSRGQPVLIGIDQEGGTKFSLGAPFTRLALARRTRPPGRRSARRAGRARHRS